MTIRTCKVKSLEEMIEKVSKYDAIVGTPNKYSTIHLASMENIINQRINTIHMNWKRAVLSHNCPMCPIYYLTNERVGPILETNVSRLSIDNYLCTIGIRFWIASEENNWNTLNESDLRKICMQITIQNNEVWRI